MNPHVRLLVGRRSLGKLVGPSVGPKTVEGSYTPNDKTNAPIRDLDVYPSCFFLMKLWQPDRPTDQQTDMRVLVGKVTQLGDKPLADTVSVTHKKRNNWQQEEGEGPA